MELPEYTSKKYSKFARKHWRCGDLNAFFGSCQKHRQIFWTQNVVKRYPNQSKKEFVKYPKRGGSYNASKSEFDRCKKYINVFFCIRNEYEVNLKISL